ncbi:MAG TPA: amino acid adenylation domain-containing protein, partial [Chloroflexota bacterium]|nr:amino acid adenylation domain-containing protein [Chloroflexota bacterium]
WQRQRLDEATLDAGLTYWTTQLAGIPQRLALVTARPRPPVQTFDADVYRLVVPTDVAEGLRRLGQAQQATLYMTLLAAFGVLLGRYSGQDDLVVGSLIANRQDAHLEALIGFFVNTLVLRLQPQPTARFDELLGTVRETTLEAYHYQDVPFERLVEALAPVRRVDTPPVVQVVFALQNAPTASLSLSGLTIERVVSIEHRVRVDLEVHAWEWDHQITVQWIYNRDLFDGAQVAQMARHYLHVLEAIVTDPTQRIGAIDLVDAAERQQLLEMWNAPTCPIPAATLPALFEAQVTRTPDAIALVCNDQNVTYTALNVRANQLAHLLIRRGVGPEVHVGVAVQRSVDVVVVLLAVLKTGAAYIPFAADHPAARLAFMCADADVALIVTTTADAARLPSTTTTITLDAADIVAACTDCPVSNPDDAVRTSALLPQHPAYVIYTSGSTGIPKAVVVEHRALSAFLAGIARPVPFSGADRLVAVSSITFDISILELLAPLCYGATVVVEPGVVARDPARVGALIAAQQATVVQATPSLWSQLMQAQTGSIGGVRVLTGGEPLLRPLARALRAQSADVCNLYGPTEATIWASTHTVTDIDVAAGEVGAVAIGRALSNYRTYVLDERLEPVPVNVTGELFLAGPGLARGYLGRPALTAERFLADPYGAAGTRMYRTGDLVRWRADGQIEFVGRTDTQIKLRGFRVELGEVEAALRRDARVEDALVIVDGEAEATRLVGYVLRGRREEVTPDERAAHLEEWRHLYNTTYADESVPPSDFNLVEWQSSYTGEAIPAGEMAIWVQETVRRLGEVGAEAVLEIGCGTGLLLTRVAGQCRRYIGLDFSATVLAQLRRYLAARPDLAHVEVREGRAHELGFVADDSVDLVILNSVVQYFPDVDYLLAVLAEATRVTRRGGHIFVGDVRSLPLLEAYH